MSIIWSVELDSDRRFRGAENTKVSAGYVADRCRFLFLFYLERCGNQGLQGNRMTQCNARI